jgi:hypothetical protein
MPARQGEQKTTAIAIPAVTSQSVLYFPRLIFVRACVSGHFVVFQFILMTVSARTGYGFATTFCCKSRSSSNSKSEYIS